MEFVYLDEHERLSDKGLSIVPLTALMPDANPYSQYILQPCGNVDADLNGVRNRDVELATTRHSAFIKLASDANAALLVTPEYSTPWQSVRNMLDEEMTPQPGALWILGCESISPDELEQFSNDYPDVCWIFESIPQTDTQTFLDPVCIALNFQNAEGNYQLVIAVQFKSQCMVDHQCYLERDHMLHGTQRYILRNNGDSVHLVVLVCSDSLAFSHQELPNPLHTPYLIVHIQLNTDPFHITFKNYRYQTYNLGGDDYEIVCANWAAGSNIAIENAGAFNTPYGGSAYYIKTPDIALDDDRFNSNHINGLYFAYCSPLYVNMYFFNYSEYAFAMQTTKPSQRMAVPALRRRTGPNMLAAHEWDQATEAWIPCESTDDGFSKCCQDLGIDEDIFKNSTPLANERLAALSTGQISKPRKSNWYHPTELLMLQTKSDETTFRFTFAQHPNVESREKRTQLLRQMHRLVSEILVDKNAFPPCISDLAEDCMIREPQQSENFDFNLADSACSKFAAGAYIGDASSSKATSTFDVMADALSNSVSRRLVVWYHDGPSLKREVQTLNPKFTDDPKLDRRSIARD